MAYNPELVKQLLGESVAQLFDGTIEVVPTKTPLIYGNLKVGDTLSLRFKETTPTETRQFVVSWK